MVLRVEVPASAAEVAADLLWEAGATAVGEEEVGPGTLRLTADLDATPPAIESAGWPVEVWVDDGAWKDGWRPFARAVAAGPFWVRPPWVDAPAPRGAVELVLDGGRAFGTGAHPSTLLALELLAPLVSVSARVLDVGCGSGALAIGAALLGATHVVAVDLDPEAILAGAANAATNRTDVVFVEDDAARLSFPLPFDVVVANVGAPLVEELAPVLLRAVAGGGAIVLSGMLEGRETAVPANYEGCSVEATATSDGWSALVLRDRSVDPLA